MTDALARRPRAVLFDLDGTLADSFPTIAAAMVEALAEHGHVVLPASVEAAIGPPMAEAVQSLAGVPADEAERIHTEYVALYLARYVEQTPELPGAGKLLDALAQHDVALAAVTNKTAQAATALLKAMGWEHHFAIVVGHESAPRAKPHADPALFALEALNVEPEDAVMVGDTEFDMECGCAAGLGGVVGLTLRRTADQLRGAGATHLCANLDEVAAVLLGSAAVTAE